MSESIPGFQRVIPHSVGKCHEVTKGTGDRWEDSPFGRGLRGQRPLNYQQKVNAVALKNLTTSIDKLCAMVYNKNITLSRAAEETGPVKPGNLTV